MLSFTEGFPEITILTFIHDYTAQNQKDQRHIQHFIDKNQGDEGTTNAMPMQQQGNTWLIYA